MKRLAAALDRALSIGLVGLLGALVAAVVWQVVSRYLLNSPSSVTEEIARYLLIWVSMLGASYQQFSFWELSAVPFESGAEVF